MIGVLKIFLITDGPYDTNKIGHQGEMLCILEKDAELNEVKETLLKGRKEE